MNTDVTVLESLPHPYPLEQRYENNEISQGGAELCRLWSSNEK